MTWFPGQSGNPDGGRGKKPIRTAIQMELAMMDEGRLDPIPRLCARMMVRKQIQKACKGDTAAFHAIADRCDGKPKVVVAGDADEPLQVSVSRGDEARMHIAKQLDRLAARQAAIQVIEGDEQR